MLCQALKQALRTTSLPFWNVDYEGKRSRVYIYYTGLRAVSILQNIEYI